MPEVTDIDSLTTNMLVEFFKRIQTRNRLVGKTIKTGVKKSTIKTQWSKLNVFFNWLQAKGYILHNPLCDIKPPNPGFNDSKALSDSELHRLYSSVVIQSVNTFMLRRDTLMISLLLYCGLRKGEFISLRVNDIDLVSQTITVRGETSKSDRTRVLKLHPTLLLHLKAYFQERKLNGIKTEVLLVSNRGDCALSRAGLKHWVKTLSKKSGVKFHLHRFRHTFACKLADANVHPFKIQKLLGHTSIVMTMRYVRSMKTEEMADDISRISI